MLVRANFASAEDFAHKRNTSNLCLLKLLLRSYLSMKVVSPGWSLAKDTIRGLWSLHLPVPFSLKGVERCSTTLVMVKALLEHHSGQGFFHIHCLYVTSRTHVHTALQRICDFMYTCSSPDPSLTGQVAETLLCGSEQLTEQPFEPSFLRPLPPLHPCFNEVRAVW